jgi:glutamyl-Q tRNA(Asp) synthetase
MDVGHHGFVCERILSAAVLPNWIDWQNMLVNLACEPRNRHNCAPMYTRILRFAPSPNGYLHLGHAYSALLNHDMARAAGGRLLLRIEDIDPQRCRPEYETAIYEDLRWLGTSWHEHARRQSENFPDYQAALAKLEADGLIYPSFESRSEINALVAERERTWPRDPDGVPLYPGTARTMSPAERERRRRAGEPFALRIAMDAALVRTGPLTWTESGSGPQGQSGRVTAVPQMWGDVVLARKELPTSYHLAVVVDDALQGITNVVRGQDLFWATGIHRLLQMLLDLPEPVYHHHRLILDADGRKLSKVTQATSLRELRAGGASAADIRGMVGL